MARQLLIRKKSGFSDIEWQKLKRLNTPTKIQDYLNKIPFNFGDTHYSPRVVLKKNKAHCFEGALLAASALWVHGHKPFLLDLKASRGDSDHVVALFRNGKKWGAISKTNHAVLRYREPVYASVRELAMSYFHEYFLFNGKKTLRSFSRPFDLSREGTSWLTTKSNLVDLALKLDRSPHTQIIGEKAAKRLRLADKIEIKSGKIVEYRE